MTPLEKALIVLEEGDRASSINMLKTLTMQEPNNAEIWSFYGIALVSQNQAEGIAALEQACKLSPDNARWYFHLGSCLNQIKEFSRATQALTQAVKLSQYSPEISLALAKSLMQLGRLHDAKSLMQTTVSLHNSPAAHHKYAQICAAMHDYSSAITAIKSAYSNAKMPEKDALLLARWYIHIKQFTAAQNIIDQVRAQSAYHSDASILAANLAIYEGNIRDAKWILEQASKHKPKDIKVLIEQLLLSSKDDADIFERAAHIEKNQNIDQNNHINLLFGLAQSADTIGYYDQAWHYAKRANKLAKKNVVFDVQVLYQQLERALDIYNQSMPLPSEQSSSDETLRQIYILGTPRCGGSLIQTVLAAAPNVASVGERGALLPWLIPMLDQEDALHHFQSQQLQLHDADLAGLRILNSSADTFVDKTTHNMHVAGLLHRIHPSAKFLHIQRNKHDTALSIFMHNFSASFPYSFEISDILSYLDFQLHAAQRWQEAGVPIITYQHDEFVASPISVGKTLFDNLGIKWSDSVLDTDKRRASVETFSALQVRENIQAPARTRRQLYASYLQSSAN